MQTSFYAEICKLKEIIRKGWLMCSVPGRLESDAEHTFSMLLLGLELIAKNNLQLDELKVVKMIAYHDLCEIDAGDTTPYDNLDHGQKHYKELICINRLAKDYNMSEIKEIWLEFEENKTPEAKFVKMLDKYDAVLQSKLYSKRYSIPEMYQEFNNNYEKIVKNMNKYKR